MLKLLSHIVVAGLIWWGVGAVGVAPVWRLGAIMLGAVTVHLVWERLLIDPYLYLGAMPVASDDPLMIQAMQEGRATLDQFLALYPHHKQDSVVKFGFQTSSGKIEYLWGDLLDVVGQQARVYVRTAPVDHQGALDRTQTISLADVVDWQVELTDGTLRGGFTNRALFKIYERQEGHMHPKLLPQLQRFRDL